MRELLRSAWQTLTRSRLRTVLTMGGIAIGTMMVVLVSGIGDVSTAAVQTELENMGVDGLSVSSSGGLTQPCLSAIRELSEVSQAMPLQVEYTTARLQHEEYNVVGCGIDAGADQVISLSLLHGRMLTPGDVLGEADVCMVDETLATESYGRTNIVGKTVSLLCEGKTRTLTVVGVTATGSSLLQNVTALIPYMIYMPYPTLQTLTGQTTFDQIAVRVRSDADTDKAEQSITRALTRSGEDIGTLMTENLATQRERLDRILGILTLVLTVISGVSLLVSGCGIMTVMLSSVHERTREIGIKKAIGATRGRILAEFLAGALLISIAGAAAGAALGIGLLYAGCALAGFHTILSPGRTAVLFLLTVLLGALFGVYPASKAASLRPVDALHSDS